jgi:amphi-Trp domain-containing protein
MAKKKQRDIEEVYSKKQFIEKLRSLVDCIEDGERFRIQISEKGVIVLQDAIFNIEHERGKRTEEIEFQLNWRVAH